MPKQEQSRQGTPQKDQDRASADADQRATDGQDYRGDGPGKIGLTSDQQPDLVAPSGVNQGDHGVADDAPSAGGTLDFEETGTDAAHPRGNVARTGGTWNEKNPSDAGELGTPGAGMSDRNGPSDPDAKRSR